MITQGTALKYMCSTPLVATTDETENGYVWCTCLTGSIHTYPAHTLQEVTDVKEAQDIIDRIVYGR